VRLTALHFVVLALTFAVFFWISDFGFAHSIEAAVNDASRTNLETVQHLLATESLKGGGDFPSQLEKLAALWANGALFEVADSRGNWIFRSSRFSLPNTPLPRVPYGGVVFCTRNLESLQYRIALQHVQAAGDFFEIHAAVPTEPFDQALDHFRILETEALPLLVLLASILGYWLSGRSLAPVNSIIETAQSIGIQNLSHRLKPPKARDELRRLTETLNAMLDRMELSFTKIGQFTADASHDLRTPLAVIRASAEITLRRPRSDSEYKEALCRILSTCVETSDMLENLLTLARADAGVVGMEMRLVDLGSCVRKAQERAVLLSVEKPLLFTAHTPPAPVWVMADTIAIDRLLLILVDNAVKFTPPGGRCQIELSEESGNAQIAVRDTGIGIAKIDLEHIFERFTRADRARSRETPGAGLGLAIARWITDMHGGTIVAESMLGSGTVFYVRLPASSNA
jgi:heavy metal sensor kinase